MDATFLYNQAGGFEEESRGRWTIFSLIKLASGGFIAVIALILFFYASYLLYKCNELPTWGRILIFVSYFVLPLISPGAFIIFNMVSPICKGSRVILPAIKIPKLST